MQHRLVPPGSTEALRGAGYGLTLFGYFETDDIEKTREYPTNSEANERWSEWMDPIMKADIDPTIDFPYILPCNGTWIDVPVVC